MTRGTKRSPESIAKQRATMAARRAAKGLAPSTAAPLRDVVVYLRKAQAHPKLEVKNLLIGLALATLRGDL